MALASFLVILVGVTAVAVFLCIALYAYLATVLPAYLAALAAAVILLFLLLFVISQGVRRISRLRRRKPENLPFDRAG